MKSILENIWLGKSEQPAYVIRKNPAYRPMAERHIRAIAELEASLSDELKAKLRLVITTHDEISAFCEKEMFMYGVRLGAELEKELQSKNMGKLSDI